MRPFNSNNNIGDCVYVVVRVLDHETDEFCQIFSKREAAENEVKNYIAPLEHSKEYVILEYAFGTDGEMELIKSYTI